jgi:hypothetical protein
VKPNTHILELASKHMSGYSVSLYEFQGLKGYILASDFSASYWVEIPDINGVVVFRENCDCGTDINENIEAIQKF